MSTITSRDMESAGTRPKSYGHRVAAATALVLSTGLVAGVWAGLANAAPSPSGTTEVIHLYSETQSLTFLSPTDKTLPGPPKDPVPGDQIEEMGNDYVGNHLHHAAKATASDHEICVFINHGLPVRCYIQVSIGGSMLLGWGGLSYALSEPYQVTGGTGRFQGATGTGLASSISSAPNANTDLTISVRLP